MLGTSWECGIAVLLLETRHSVRSAVDRVRSGAPRRDHAGGQRGAWGTMLPTNTIER